MALPGCFGNPGPFPLAPPFSTCGSRAHWKEEKECGGLYTAAFMGRCPLLTPDCKGCWEMWSPCPSEGVHGGTVPVVRHVVARSHVLSDTFMHSHVCTRAQSQAQTQAHHTQPQAHSHASIPVDSLTRMLTHSDPSKFKCTYARILRDTCPDAQKQTPGGVVHVHAHGICLTTSDLGSPRRLPLLCGFPGGEGRRPSGPCTQLLRLFSAGTGE